MSIITTGFLQIQAVEEDYDLLFTREISEKTLRGQSIIQRNPAPPGQSIFRECGIAEPVLTLPEVE